MNKDTTYTPIRIVIIDDHPVVRRGIASFIEDEEGITIIGEAADAEEGKQLLQDVFPDVAVIDICLGDPINGIELLRSLNLRLSGLKVLVLSMYDDAVYAERVRTLGARGYLQKNRGPHMIVEGIKKIFGGRSFFPEDYKHLIENSHSSEPTEQEKQIIQSLTTRELLIFQLFGEGYESTDIAKRLELSKHTVDSHRKNIKSKLGITRNNELVRLAVQWNISTMKKPV